MYVLDQKYFKYKKSCNAVFIFFLLKNLCIFHGQVFVMEFPGKNVINKRQK